MIKIENINYIDNKWVICNNYKSYKEFSSKCKNAGYLGKSDHPNLRFPIFISFNQNNKHILSIISLEKRPGSTIFYPSNIIF